MHKATLIAQFTGIRNHTPLPNVASKRERRGLQVCASAYGANGDLQGTEETQVQAAAQARHPPSLRHATHAQCAPNTHGQPITAGQYRNTAIDSDGGGNRQHAHLPDTAAHAGARESPEPKTKRRGPPRASMTPTPALPTTAARSSGRSTQPPGHGGARCNGSRTHARTSSGRPHRRPIRKTEQGEGSRTITRGAPP